MTERREGLLHGVSWDHTRGLLPAVATAQRYHEQRPEAEIAWHKRTLHEFGHAAIADLAERFDLIVIDHPFAGELAESGWVHPLDGLLPPAFVDDLRNDSCGRSFESYLYAGRLWAVPIDGAAPSSACRPDLLGGAPDDWADVIALARKGQVAFAGFHADSLLTWLAFSTAFADGSASDDSVPVDRSAGEQALDCLRELAQHLDPKFFNLNPIQTYEAMIASAAYAYSPIAYSYVNYAVPGYGSRLLRFGQLPALPDGKRPRSMLGGTGLAISARCEDERLELALDYLRYVAARETQCGLYGLYGGQPARLSAWQDGRLNAMASNFFADTLPVMQQAAIRPRHKGYMRFQEQAGHIVVECLKGERSVASAFEALSAFYRETCPVGATKWEYE